jgi:hypothetical protein
VVLDQMREEQATKRNSRKPLVIAAVGVVFVLAAVGVAIFAASSNGPTTRTPVASGGSHIRYVVTEYSAPAECGPWATSSADPTAMDFARDHGGISGCGLTGDTWIIATAGTSNPAAAATNEPPPIGATWSNAPEIAVYNCEDPTAAAASAAGTSASNGGASSSASGPVADASSPCMDPSQPHPYGSWRHYAAPAQGFIKLLAVPEPGVIMVDIAGNQLIFNAHTGTWESPPGQALQACMKSWGGGGGDATSSTSVQLGFLSSNPQCITAQ